MINYEPVTTDDYVAIQRLVHRYADAVVNRDAQQWGSCWADGAEWDLGRGRHVVGIDAIVELWSKAMAGMHAVVQTVDNGDAWYAPDDRNHARGRWYITETYRRAAKDGIGEAGILRAHYDDTYIRTDAGWKFSNRLLQAHYHGPSDLSAEFTNTEQGLRERLQQGAGEDA